MTVSETPHIRMINGDSLEAMAGMEDNAFELAIVDPPYGNESDATKTFTSNSVNRRAKRTKYKQFDNKVPKNAYFEELKRVSEDQIIWGANFFGIKGGYIAWNKHGTAFGEGELAFNSKIQSIRFIDYVWNGMLQENMKNKEYRIHPNQKPVDVYKEILRDYATEGDRILDTHGGSGSIAIACYDMGFDLDWYELDEDYYEDAVNRFQDHKKQGQLFTPEEQYVKPEQKTIFEN